MPAIDPQLFERAIAVERRRVRNARVLGFLIAGVLLSPAGYVVARLQGLQGSRRMFAAMLLSFGMVIVGLAAITMVRWFMSKVVLSVLQPGGSARPQASHSKAEALAAAGRLDEASHEFEMSRASGRESIASLRAEAELHATAAGDPKRAEALLLRIRQSPDAAASDQLYASHRLIDLYIGLLDDPARAMVELKRMADRFPNTIDGQGALAEWQRRRAAGA